MKGLTQTLLFILVLQIVGTVIAFSGDSSLDAYTPEEPFLAVSLDSLTEVRIVPGEGEDQGDAVTLMKDDGKWILKNYYNFPASSQKLETIKDTLLSLKKPYPVGTSEIAAKQFEVGEENFKMKVEFATDAAVIETAYFGSSPSFKKVHARVGGNNNTYSLPFSVFSIKGKPKTWIDRDYLKLPVEEIPSVDFPTFSVIRTDEGLTIEGLKQDEQVDQKELMSHFKAAIAPSFIEVLSLVGKDDKNLKEHGLDKPSFEYTVVKKDNEERKISFANNEAEKFYAMKVSDSPYLYKVSSFQAEKIINGKRDTFVTKKAPEEAKETEIETKEEQE